MRFGSRSCWLLCFRFCSLRQITGNVRGGNTRVIRTKIPECILFAKQIFLSRLTTVALPADKSNRAAVNCWVVDRRQAAPGRNTRLNNGTYVPYVWCAPACVFFQSSFFLFGLGPLVFPLRHRRQFIYVHYFRSPFGDFLETREPSVYLQQ